MPPCNNQTVKTSVFFLKTTDDQKDLWQLSTFFKCVFTDYCYCCQSSLSRYSLHTPHTPSKKSPRLQWCKICFHLHNSLILRNRCKSDSRDEVKFYQPERAWKSSLNAKKVLAHTPLTSSHEVVMLPLHMSTCTKGSKGSRKYCPMSFIGGGCLEMCCHTNNTILITNVMPFLFNSLVQEILTCHLVSCTEHLKTIIKIACMEQIQTYQTSFFLTFCEISLGYWLSLAFGSQQLQILNSDSH